MCNWNQAKLWITCIWHLDAWATLTWAFSRVIVCWLCYCLINCKASLPDCFWSSSCFWSITILCRFFLRFSVLPHELATCTHGLGKRFPPMIASCRFLWTLSSFSIETPRYSSHNCKCKESHCRWVNDRDSDTGNARLSKSLWNDYGLLWCCVHWT